MVHLLRLIVVSRPQISVKVVNIQMFLNFTTVFMYLSNQYNNINDYFVTSLKNCGAGVEH